MYQARWSITTLTRADLIPLLCRECGLRLDSDPEAVLFVCPVCGLAHEPMEGHLEAFRPFVAAANTSDASQAVVHYLAVWRLTPASAGTLAPTSMRAATGAIVYVPAFSLARVVLENLGVRLTQRQPLLEPAAVPLSDRTAGGRGPFSPVVLGRGEARILSPFVHLSLALREGRDERTVAQAPAVVSEELVFIPAVDDPRCVHDAGWRLLLREFDQ
jgi:hypothetical protein